MSVNAEILAPAGDPSCVRAAVTGGADAVYLGASAFSARAKAGNFTPEELATAVEYCHLFGVKVYLAVNTILKPEEYSRAESVIKEGVSAGVDAFIVQDLPFILHLHSTMPHIVIHLSTQAGVHNAAGAIAAEKLGVRRVVLSRETLLRDVREIRARTDLELEYFVHGALCVAFSGNCYLSSMAAALSGNRGRCLQLCRKKYKTNGREGYFLSARDLDLSERLNELADAGVCSFKIEGRMRRPEYVGETVKYYKDILGGKTGDRDALKTLFNRGDFCEGYLDSPTAPVIYPRLASHSGLKIGSVKAVSGGKAELVLARPLHAGDGLKFLRDGAETGSASVRTAGKTVGFSGNVHAGDSVHITTDSELSERILSRTRKLHVTAAVSGGTGGPLTATLTCGSVSVTEVSDFSVERAVNKPFTPEEVRECFLRTGGTEFEPKRIDVEFPENAFVARSALNDFRRNAYDALKNAILQEYDRNAAEVRAKDNIGVRHGNITDLFGSERFEEIRTIVQIDDPAAAEYAIPVADAIAYFPRFYGEEVISDIKKITSESGKRMFLTLPIMVRGDDETMIAKILASPEVRDVIVNNIGGLELAKGKNILLGPMMNIIDPDFCSAKILSPECERAGGDGFVYAFGRVPLATFAHCPIKTLSGGECKNCGRDRRAVTLTDERGNDFPCRFYKVAYCYAQLLNCVPLDVADLAIGSRRFIDLAGFDKEEIRTVTERLSHGERLWPGATRGYFAKKLL